MDITTVETILEVRNRRQLAPAEGRRVTCPAVPGSGYELPGRIVRRLPTGVDDNARSLLAGVSVWVWAYFKLGGAIDDVPVAEVWRIATAAAARKPGHTGDQHGSCECCARCLHDTAVLGAARMLTRSTPTHHLSLIPTSEPSGLGELFGRARDVLHEYVAARRAQYHDHPLAGLLVPSKMTGAVGDPAPLHVHVLLDGSTLHAATLTAIARARGFGVGGSIREPMPDSFGDRARIIAYVVRQVLTCDPLTERWRTTRHALWLAKPGRSRTPRLPPGSSGRRQQDTLKGCP